VIDARTRGSETPNTFLWVFSLPIELRYRLAHDGELLSDVLAVFLRAVRGWYRKQARKAGHLDTRCGCVTFAQRFGSALNLNPHFHTLMLDGVYSYADGDGAPLFVPAPTLTDDDVRELVETVATRVLRLLERRGMLDGAVLDPLAERSPVLAGMTAASVQGLVATGERAGRIVRRVLSDPAGAVRTSASLFFPRVAFPRTPPRASRPTTKLVSGTARQAFPVAVGHCSERVRRAVCE
jgi:hypothetical protein